MSLAGKGLLAGLCLLLLPGLARAQESKPPFYDSDPESDAEKEGTAFSGNITSSSFYFTEKGDANAAAADGAEESASFVDRVFTELRLKLKADHISGGKLDFRADTRFRTQIERCEARLADVGQPAIEDCLPSQSGTFGGEERDIRELYLRYRGGPYDVSVGRQFMSEIAGIKFDGVRIEQNKSEGWKYFGFAGLYPVRGARDYRAEYPVYALDPADPAAGEARLLPVVGGAGGSYRIGKAYGNVGAGGILPRANEASTGLVERNRIFLSANGYWSQSNKTDIYHYVVVDAAGANGAGLTNLSLGVNHRPATAVNIFARVNRVDTETLNVQAQLRLDPIDPNAAVTRVQNNWYVNRVAQESGTVGASSAFSQNRFQVSASGTLRRRPEIEIQPVGPLGADEIPVVLPLAQALDINLEVVDRKSFANFRIGGSVTRTLERGDENLDRAKSTIARLEGSRDLKEGKGEFELNLEYIQSSDQDLVENCAPGQADFLNCFGTAEASTIGAGGMIFYRPKKEWYAMGMATVATQTLTTTDSMGNASAQPATLMLSAFARLAYRF